MHQSEVALQALSACRCAFRRTQRRTRWSSGNKTCCKVDNAHLDHARACKYGPYRNSRHNALRDELAELITEITGHRPLKEQIINLPPSTTNITTNPLEDDDDDKDG